MDDSTTSSPPPLHRPPPDHDYEKTLPPSPPRSKRSGSSRTPSSRSSREQPRSTPTARDLLRMLSEEQETTRDLEQQLTLNTSQLAYEQDRADAAERRLKEAVVRFKDANDARVSAQADAAKLREELKLYKSALEEAQREIFKAQNILKDVEGRRREAEEEAAQLRRKLRKINEERMINVAREEGRKQGLQEGLEMGTDIGYLRGRNSGYINGRSTADRVLERYFSPPPESETRRSRGEPDLPPESEAPYTATTTRFPASDDSTRSSSSLSEREVPRYSRAGGTRTSSARTTMYSPAQGQTEVLHEGFIPEADASMIIRLPPPHELARPPPTPVGTLPSDMPLPTVAPVPVPGGSSVLMVPEPRSPRNAPYDSPGERQHRKVRRKSSGESVGSSTRTSELDILNAPEQGPRSSGLSVIPEVASVQEAGTPCSQRAKPEGEDRVDEAGFVHVSMPAPLTAAEMASLKGSRSLSVDQRRPGSTSSFGTVNITIQPPSRPASNMSATTTAGTRHLLSPADADRPVPLPHHAVETIVMDVGDRGLPPGFVPLGSTGVVIPPPSGYGETDSSSSEGDTLSTPRRYYVGCSSMSD